MTRIVDDGTDGPRWPLTVRIGLSVGITVAALVAGFGAAVGVMASATLLDRAADRQEALVVELARVLEQDLRERDFDTHTTARTPEVLRVLSDEPAGATDTPELRAELTRMLDAPSPLAWIGLVDRAGLVRLASGGLLEGEDVTERPWFVEGLQGPYLGDAHDAVLLAEHRPEPTRLLDLVHPVEDANGAVVGVVAAHLPFTWVEQRSRQVLAIESGAELTVTVTDATGAELWHSDPQRLSDPEQLVTSTAALDLGGLHWVLAVSQPRIDVTAGARVVRNRMVAAGLVVGLLTAGVALLAVRRSVRGLRRLDDAARAMHAQHLGAGTSLRATTLPLVTGRDDIARASRSLRTLTDHLIAQQQELEQTSEALSDALAIRDDFVAMAGHEMRTPVTVVRGAVELLRARDQDLSTEQRRLLDEALVRNLDRLERLSANLVLARHLDAGQLPGELQQGCAVEVAALLAQVAPQAHREGTPLRVRTNGPVLDLTVGHLVENARRYGQTPVTVRWWLDAAAAQLVVAVEDDGPGVPPGFEPHLFERFSQSSRGDRRTATGTGIGLWLTAQVLHAVDGTIRYERPMRGGSRFVVTLPVHGVDEQREIATSHRA